MFILDVHYAFPFQLFVSFEAFGALFDLFQMISYDVILCVFVLFEACLNY